MIIFVNIKNAKFCQITLRIKRFIHKRKAVPFFLVHGVVVFVLESAFFAIYISRHVYIPCMNSFAT